MEALLLQPDHNTTNQTNTTSRVQVRGDPITALMERSLVSYLHMACFNFFSLSFFSQIIVSLRMSVNTRKCSVTVLFVFHRVQSQRGCVNNTRQSSLQHPSLRCEDMAGVKQLVSMPLLPAVRLWHTPSPHAHPYRRLYVDITSKNPKSFSSAAVPCLWFHVCECNMCPFLA